MLTEILPLRLAPGQDLRTVLEEQTVALGGGAFVLSGIGSLVNAEIRFANEPGPTTITGPLEILTIAGSLARNGGHLHLTVADSHGQVFGGHLCHGSIVRTTAEVLLALLPEWQLTREHDPTTGYQELVVEKKTAEHAFRQAVQRHLAQLDSPLHDALVRLITHSYPPKVTTLAFEIFADTFTAGFPVRVFFLDQDNGEYFIYVNGEARSPSPIDPGILTIERTYPQELEETLRTDSDSRAWELATDELITWFSKHWTVAGGTTFPLNATLAHHDSSQAFNLKTKQWQAND